MLHLPPHILHTIGEMLLPHNSKENVPENHFMNMLMDCIGWKVAHRYTSRPSSSPSSFPSDEGERDDRISDAWLMAIQVMYNAAHMDGEHIVYANKEQLEIIRGPLHTPILPHPFSTFKLICKRTWLVVQDLVFSSRAIGVY
jgi:hypothetical protein